VSKDGVTSIPYVAGIRGHQGSIVGDDPGFYDKVISGQMGPDIFGIKLTMLAASLTGIQIPEYGNTEIDSQYLESIKKTREPKEVQ
jgi:hypothetical protein